MGNCLKPRDPLEEILPRESGIDASAVRDANPPIICLIGGPGTSQSERIIVVIFFSVTQSIKVTEKFRLVNIISSDILRDEVHTRSVKGVVLARYMSQGRLVPADVLIELIKTKLLAHLNTARGFLLVGFPREKDQGKLFERQVKPFDLLIYLSARNSVLRERVMAKAVTLTERLEASEEKMKERIKGFHKMNKPILRHYKNKLAVINAENDDEKVFEDICRAIEKTLKIVSPINVIA
ncbi:PREDICTED: adenylate kinase isoenzyme 1-like [Polistes dominula]|uniref:Adenylate kinase isoenzyme 1-like n=1 Tax=Polistes dominula TaxID=743375 RepID=A0ABM1IM87_POLDO|nr:PREDICTED: adenylate kinase isoenzyme 1-like [Polistes dominula]